MKTANGILFLSNKIYTFYHIKSEDATAFADSWFHIGDI